MVWMKPSKKSICFSTVWTKSVTFDTLVSSINGAEWGVCKPLHRRNEKVFFFDDLLSSINGDFWTFENFCMSVPTRAKLLHFWTFEKILSHLREKLVSHGHHFFKMLKHIIFLKVSTNCSKTLFFSLILNRAKINTLSFHFWKNTQSVRP